MPICPRCRSTKIKKNGSIIGYTAKAFWVHPQKKPAPLAFCQGSTGRFSGKLTKVFVKNATGKEGAKIKDSAKVSAYKTCSAIFSMLICGKPALFVQKNRTGPAIEALLFTFSGFSEERVLCLWKYGA